MLVKQPTEKTDEFESAYLNIDEYRQCAGSIIEIHFLHHEKPLLCFSNERKFEKTMEMLEKNEIIVRNCEKVGKKKFYNNAFKASLEDYKIRR